MKKILPLALAALLAGPTVAQTPRLRSAARPTARAAAPTAPASALSRPKLVVGIVVDQMRYDFLYRYWAKFGSGGFRRLLGEGFSFESCHYNYVPTYTGPGHASIYTGSS